MNLPDDLADLERDLAARSHPELSANFRPRVLSAVARELAQSSTNTNSPPSRRNRLYHFLIASGIAASLAWTFTIWQFSAPPRRRAPSDVHYPSTLTHSFDNLTTWRNCRHALAQSPHALDQLLEKNPPQAPSPPPQTFLHTHTNFLALNGDL